MDGFLPADSWLSDSFPSTDLVLEVDIFAPLARPRLADEVRGLVEKAFKDTTKAYSDRLCALLEHYGFHSLALLAHLHHSILLSPSQATEAESNFAKVVQKILCGDSKQNAHWDCFKRFLESVSEALHSRASSDPLPHVTSVSQLLSNLITRKMQATSDAARAQGYQRLHAAYFGAQHPTTILAHWFSECTQEQIHLRCAFPGCTHPVYH